MKSNVINSVISGAYRQSETHDWEMVWVLCMIIQCFGCTSN